MPKKSYLKILNGDDHSDEDEKTKVVLGTSKRQFEAQINKGFERNIPRYNKKNEEMMAMECLIKWQLLTGQKPNCIQYSVLILLGISRVRRRRGGIPFMNKDWTAD